MYVPISPVPSLRSLTDCRQTGTDEIISIAHGWGSHETVPLKISAYSNEQLSNINFLTGGVGDGTSERLHFKHRL